MKKQLMNQLSTVASNCMVMCILAALVFPAYPLDMGQIQASFKRLGGQAQVLNEWQMMLRDASELPVYDKLRSVNEFFNRHIAFAENKAVWGKEDYWATPTESLAKSRGDCKAYVIAKYFALLELNIPVKQLRLIYVKAQIGGEQSPLQQAHMILAYYPTPDAEPQILDNLITEIRPASRRSDLLPIFSFNSEGVFVGVSGGAVPGPGGVGQLSHWADLLRRAHSEGF